jgi:hypothetical protein
MTSNKAEKNNSRDALKIDKDTFTPGTPDDDLRVDLQCKHLLQHFYNSLVTRGVSPREATAQANGADYFIRDFVVDFMGLNLFDEHPGVVRQFAGNWYIVGTIEPDIQQLAGHLGGVRAFYHYLRDHGLISAGYLQNIDKECDDIAYYEHRIESFWTISGDGYLVWERECSLKGSGRTKG